MSTDNRPLTTGNRKLTLRKLDSLELESIHTARNWSKADVSIAQWPPGSGRRVVIKDLRHRPLWFRVLAGRYLLWREWRALCTLADLEGVPAPIARPAADIIIMEYCAGEPLDRMSFATLSQETVARLERFIQKLHARGVTHGDLHGYNILVAPNGDFAIIDWATAGVFGAAARGAKKFAFEEWKALDERALAKVKIVHAPQEITSRQRDLLLKGGSRIYRLLKRFKNGMEKLRGVEEEKLNARAVKQDQYEKLLQKYSASE